MAEILFPEVEKQRLLIKELLAQYRDTAFRADLRLSFIEELDVGEAPGDKEQHTREVLRTKREKNNSVKAIRKLQARLDALPAEVVDDIAEVDPVAAAVPSSRLPAAVPVPPTPTQV